MLGIQAKVLEQELISIQEVTSLQRIDSPTFQNEKLLYGMSKV